jgi:predicted enzyme related to lactoylglutathione lyase
MLAAGIDRVEQRATMDFNSILIGSEDPERLVEYYTRVLGTAGFSDGGYTGWKLGSGYVTVGPHPEVHGQNAAPGRIIWNIESKDVDADCARMKAAGAIVVAEPYGFDGMPDARIATFADPDDNYFQLMSPKEM